MLWFCASNADSYILPERYLITYYNIGICWYFHHSLQSPPLPKVIQPTEEAPSVPASATLSVTVNKPQVQVPPFVESIYTTHPTMMNTSEEHSLRRNLRVQLSNVSSHRLRKLSDVEECEVQPDVSNFPLRYGQQRRPSNTSAPVSFTFLTHHPTLLILLFSHQILAGTPSLSTLNHKWWQEGSHINGV